MESSRLPIELCEAVMSTLREHCEFPYGGWFLLPGYSESEAQPALYACALTCRAWRVRAQYLLWTFPMLSNNQRFTHFKTAIRRSPNKTIIRGLVLSSEDDNDHDKTLDLSMAAEIIMHSFPHLQSLLCHKVHFERGPPLRLLRMRLPFFSTITSLVLLGCTFQSMRAMLDVVWACSNLTTLAVGENVVKLERRSAAGFQNLFTTAETLRACRKLTRLTLSIEATNIFWKLPIVAGINGVGRVFGCAITELHCATDCAPGELLSILRDSFPALHSVTVVSGFHGDPKLPWLHVIAIGRPICGILKTIVLEYEHRFEKYDCCKEVVGSSEVVVGSEKRLPELLAGLAELTIRLDECEDPGRCAAYIWFVLPGMHDVLRFEYRARWGDAWKLYTLSVVK